MVSCNKYEAAKNLPVEIKTQTEEDDFFPEYYSKDTLSLNVMIDDCGEWGGPEDEFRIYRDSLRQYTMDFKRYSFNCDSIGKYYGIDKPLEFKKTLVMNDSSKKVISIFFVDLMKAKIQENLKSNGGSRYKLFNNDYTLLIDVYSDEKEIEEEYYKFKKGLGFPENRKRENTVPNVTVID